MSDRPGPLPSWEEVERARLDRQEKLGEEKAKANGFGAREAYKLESEVRPPSSLAAIPPHIDAPDQGGAGVAAESQPMQPCDLPAIDPAVLFDGPDPPPTRWMIDKIHPIGTGGLLSGPGSGGKSFLELMRLVCIASGAPWLGFYVEQAPVLAYFSEDNEAEIIRRVRRICDGLGIDHHALMRHGQLQLVPTVGAPRALFDVGPDRKTRPTEWFWQIAERAKRDRACYIAFDHIGRYWRIEYHMNNSQVFDAWTWTDKLAAEIDGAITYLHHKEGSDLIAKLDQVVSVQKMVGGAGALVNGPRCVQTLRWLRPTEDEPKFRLLQSHKVNFGDPLAVMLVENGRGIVENAGELDPDQLVPKAKGRPTKADQTSMPCATSTAPTAGRSTSTSWCGRPSAAASSWNARRSPMHGGTGASRSATTSSRPDRR